MFTRRRIGTGILLLGAIFGTVFSVQAVTEPRSRSICTQHSSCIIASTPIANTVLQKFEFLPTPIVITLVLAITAPLLVTRSTFLPRSRKRQSFILHACYRV